MGYHVTILRTIGKQNVPIEEKEVEELPRLFPEWQYDKAQTALVSVDDSDDAPALWYSDGQLWTTNPSNETITSMLALANRLGARVRGDELETYSSINETYTHPDDMEALAQLETESKTFSKQTKIHSLVFRGLAFVGAILLFIALIKLGLIK